MGATAGGLVATGAGMAASYGGSKLMSKVAGGGKGNGGTLPYQPLDINKTVTDARDNAAKRYADAIALRKQFDPGQDAFYNAATTAAMQSAVTGPGGATYGGTPLGNSMLNESAEAILADFRLGDKLSADTQAAVARAALSSTGQAGLAGSFAARGGMANSIGKTSYEVGNARRNAVFQAGGILDALGMKRAEFAAGQRDVNARNAFQLKTVADAAGLPDSGLSSGEIASLYVGNNNAGNQVAQNQFEANNLAQGQRASRMNELLGFGMQAANAYFTGPGGKRSGTSYNPDLWKTA